MGDGPDATAKKKKQQHDDDHGSSHRHRRRKTRHARRSGDDKDNRKGKRKGKDKNRQADLAPAPGCSPNPVAQTCAGTCGKVKNNCGQNVTCSPCPPAIVAFTASPTTIDRGATPAEEATISWSTSNATTCSIDNGVGSVPCNGNASVGPSTTTTYTLSASGAGGGQVTGQAVVTVQYCHAIAFDGGTCPTGATEFCEATLIQATSSAHAQDACETCFGEGTCINNSASGGEWWANIAHLTFFYFSNQSSGCGRTAGDITNNACNFFSRWAP